MTSIVTARDAPVHMAPDESDLLDAPLSPMQESAAATPRRGPPPSSTQATLIQPLIPVSTRFWFGVFRDTMPDADSLNERDGMGCARLPTDLPADARPGKLQWFCIDEDLVYLSFSNDWGPLNIAMFYRFCVHVHQMLIDPETQGMHLVLYTTTHPHHKANAALLCALYAMTIDHLTPADAFYPYSEMEFMPFRDAGYGRADYSLTIQDILYGMRRALDHGLLDLTTFDLESYEHYEQVQNGDWNWITPHFLAFASPKDRAFMASLAAAGPAAAASAAKRMPVNPMLQSTVKYFQEHNISLVVRLNNALYHRSVFENAGMQHKDLYFDDGSNPSEDIIRTFIHEADRVISQGGAIAVHCKAGLGRTGVLIGAYLIWKYGFSASEVIGYMRLMRPGCVVGPQQHFMYENATTWMRWGVEDRLRAQWAKEATPSPALPVPETPAKVEATTTSLPHIKPTPCVGQPRKSPSPKRRRVGMAALATTETQATHTPSSAAVSMPAARSRVVSDEKDAESVEAQLKTPRTDAEVLGVVERTPSSTAASRVHDEARMPRATALSTRSPRRAMAPAQPTATSTRSTLPSPKAVAPRSATRITPRPGSENRPPTVRNLSRASPRARP
ncbi:cell division control protein 14 [Malassezia pachydermatis]|uniref:protein-tyrosine-phosphatase n=1 Tax=Malassezia pachydermatis TaxID=77020 RepID=A0A0M8MYG8_9BASI|nr:phosphoprotein phosphatase [Malassezia pachydermatis]KOS16250.1 phosphoprotein phosphatase [Malassezia pachydermatis]